MKKEIILERLRELGFSTEEISEVGYIFEYEGLRLLYLPDDDERFLQFAAPSIYDVTAENRAMVLEVINDVNSSVKYGKVCVYNEIVWVVSEHRLSEEDDITDIIEHHLLILHIMVGMFQKKIQSITDGVLDANEDKK